MLTRTFRTDSLFRCTAVFLLLAALGQAQGKDTTPDPKTLIERLTKDPIPLVSLNQVAAAGLTEAIPILKKKFELNRAPASSPVDKMLSDELMEKAGIASALVRLGVNDAVYWNFLVAHAKPAVESDAPFPMLIDPKTRKAIVTEPPPEFLAWAKTRNVPAKDAAQVQLLSMPGRIIPLAASGDPRGLPVLRQALSSRNYLVQMQAASGLALLRDIDSVPRIIEVCEKSPSDFVTLIARALVFFDDPRAQAASEKFVQNPTILLNFPGG